MDHRGTRNHETETLLWGSQCSFAGVPPLAGETASFDTVAAQGAFSQRERR
jgi:hypothetical protein